MPEVVRGPARFPHSGEERIVDDLHHPDDPDVDERHPGVDQQHQHARDRSDTDSRET